jgi:hypothetical protein
MTDTIYGERHQLPQKLNALHSGPEVKIDYSTPSALNTASTGSE